MRKNYHKHNYRCHECGRYCIPYDRGTYYGSTYDYEPPDEIVWCRTCVDDKVKHYKNINHIDCWYIVPNFIRALRAAEVAGDNN